MTSRMTLRVGTVHADGRREFGRARVVRVKPNPAVPREDACRYPPCACPRHRPDLHEGATAARALSALSALSALKDSPSTPGPVRSMVELWAVWRL